MCGAPRAYSPRSNMSPLLLATCRSETTQVVDAASRLYSLPAGNMLAALANWQSPPPFTAARIPPVSCDRLVRTVSRTIIVTLYASDVSVNCNENENLR